LEQLFSTPAAIAVIAGEPERVVTSAASRRSAALQCLFYCGPAIGEPQCWFCASLDELAVFIGSEPRCANSELARGLLGTGVGSSICQKDLRREA
jgi:hypothetical protein